MATDKEQEIISKEEFEGLEKKYDMPIEEMTEAIVGKGIVEEIKKKQKKSNCSKERTYLK